MGQIHVFPLGSWMTILYIWFAEVVPAYLAYIRLLDGREAHLL